MEPNLTTQVTDMVAAEFMCCCKVLVFIVLLPCIIFVFPLHQKFNNIYNKYFLTKLTTPSLYLHSLINNNIDISQKNMHVSIQLQNSNWFTKKNK